jgi:hypothetical protein
MRRRFGSYHRSRPTRSSAQRRVPGLAAHGLNDSAQSGPQRDGNHRSRPTRSSAQRRNRLTRCRQARQPGDTLNAGAVLLDATAVWIVPPVTPNALGRTAPRPWPSGTRVKRFCAVHTPARWESPVTPNALECIAARRRNRLTRCRQARQPGDTLNAGAVLLDATARWTKPPVTPNALERTAARRRNRLTRCR